jgi:hypothetical protein
MPVLRQKTSTQLWLNEGQGWKDFGSFVQKAGQSVWLGEGYLTEKEIYRVICGMCRVTPSITMSPLKSMETQEQKK